jgi:hypothetical protein
VQACFAVVIGAALAALLGGCGEEKPDVVTEAETGVAAVLDERLDLPTGTVSVACPDELELDPGVAFTCDMTVRGEVDSTEIDLAVRDDGTVELQRAVIPVDAAESFLTDELAPTAEGPVTVDCGAARIVVRSVGETFDCAATRTADGVVFLVVVEVTAVDGTVRYTVERTTTTAPATVPTTPGSELPTP